ncbi:hypothetical protein B0A55_02829 [Friedmanniomyces simplex]|uniref:Uncharacterized protein n=1 Tax=Friedmanniomyces simplex TaxID=329884 RepID=A0A4V5NHK0_9PEZI|nr:hypothetical protein B0A55_02829 [Friedmanniomyces simplex]
MRLRYLQAIAVHSRGGFTEALERRILAFTGAADPKASLKCYSFADPIRQLPTPSPIHTVRRHESKPEGDPDYAVPANGDQSESSPPNAVAATSTPRKIKSRPASHPVAELLPPIILPPTNPPPAPRHPTISTPLTEPIPVSPTSLDLFLRMFTPTATHKKTSSVPWDDLVAALVDAGCTVDQKSGGSAVNFILLDRAGAGRLSIHRPHPDSRVKPILLKDCARKVEKYFGWRREGFVERVRTPAG